MSDKAKAIKKTQQKTVTQKNTTSKSAQKKYTPKGGKRVITSINDFDPENIIFDGIEPKSVKMANGGTTEYKSVPIYYKQVDENGNEERCQLILQTEKVYSHGVSFNEKSDRPELQFPLCLWSIDGATEEEQKWTETFDEIVDKSVEFLVDNCAEIGRPGEEDDLPKELTKIKGGIAPIYWKTETITEDVIDPATGKPVTDKNGKVKTRTKIQKEEGSGPTLYPKFMVKRTVKKDDKNNDNSDNNEDDAMNMQFYSTFYDEALPMGQDEVNPIKILGKPLYATVALRIESIYIGSKIKLQVKIIQANFSLKNMNRTRLLAKPPVVTSENDFEDDVDENLDKEEKKENDDTGSLNLDEDDDLDLELELNKKPKKNTKTAKNVSRLGKK